MNPTRPHSAAEVASVERLGALLEVTINQRKPAEDLHGSDDISLQPKPGEDLDIIPRVGRLDGETSDRVRAMESRTKRRSSRGFARFLVAICIGVAGTLAWQSYGEATKQIIAASAPELGWSPEAKQMIASWVQQLGWAKPATGPENTAAQLPAPKMPQAAPLAQVGAETVEQRLAVVREPSSSSPSVRIRFYVRSLSCTRKSLRRSQRLRRSSRRFPRESRCQRRHHHRRVRRYHRRRRRHQ